MSLAVLLWGIYFLGFFGIIAVFAFDTWENYVTKQSPNTNSDMIVAFVMAIFPLVNIFLTCLYVIDHLYTKYGDSIREWLDKPVINK